MIYGRTVSKRERENNIDAGGDQIMSLFATHGTMGPDRDTVISLISTNNYEQDLASYVMSRL